MLRIARQGCGQAADLPPGGVDAQVADLKAGQEKLMKSAQSLFTKMYENMQQNNSQGGQAGPGPDQNAGGQAGGSGDDDVVDADYKEV